MNDHSDILVSIALLSYNHEPYLRRCLDSILAQKTSFRFEVIVAEDCSPDHSREILREYEQKHPELFRMVYNEKNLGPTKNAMMVQKLCTSKYVSIGESDDFWTDEYRLQKQVDFLEAHPEYIAVACNNYSVDPDGNDPKISLLRWQVNKAYSMHDFFHYGFVFHSNTLLHRNVLPVSGERYETLRASATTMGDMIRRVFLYDQGEIFVLPDIMHAHRSGAQNATSFSASIRRDSMPLCFMQVRMIRALDVYFAGKHDFTPMLVNFSSVPMLMRYIDRANVDPKEYRRYYAELPSGIVFRARLRFLQKVWRRALHKVARRLKLFYRVDQNV